MIYETFLLTRNQKRDFTAFIRPADLTNKEVSVVASALNNVRDVASLTPDWPALYSLVLGEYHLLLRHYDSGRTHAGRSIGVVEGIAVRRTHQQAYTQALPALLAQQSGLLNIAASVPDIESVAAQLSAEHDWPDETADVPQAPKEDELVQEFATRLQDDRLFLPFTPEGRALLMAALSHLRPQPADFAFGTNSDVLARLNEAGVGVDIVSYFNTSAPALRSRQTNEITRELTDFAGKLPSRPAGRIEIEADPNYPTEDLPDRIVLEHRLQYKRAKPKVDPLAAYDAGEEAMLTPRELRRRERTEAAAQEVTETDDSRGWFARLIARLLGRD